MLNFFTPVSAMRSSQTAIATVSNNIANANTPGYHRQEVLLADLPPTEFNRFQIGAGVEVAQVRRAYHDAVEQALTANTSDLAASSARGDALRQIESVFTPGPGSLTERVESFFNELSRLQSNPSDSAQRGIVLRSGDALAGELQASSQRLNTIRGGLIQEAQRIVDDINVKSAEVARLNKEIRLAEGRGTAPNSLLDRRDQLVNELAELTDASLVDNGASGSAVLFGSGRLLIGERPPVLELATDADGQAIIREQNGDAATFASGRLAGLLDVANDRIGYFQGRLDEFAGELIHSFNQVQATGIGTAGPFSSLIGQRGVADVAVPLSEADPDFPIQAGELAITVTDKSSGERRVTALTIDPASQSLQDIAAAISGVDGVNAVVDSTTGTLSIVAENGFAFDFAGQLETTPDLSSITGSSQPRISGSYTGAANDAFQFTIAGTGTVGVTDGLSVEVRNNAGDLLGTFDLGSAYAPGEPLAIADGVSIAFGAGTFNAGDSFSTPVIADSDTAGVLSALGLNQFFSGTSASDIRIAAELRQNPSRLATARSTESADNRNLTRLVRLRDDPRLSGGTRTFEELLADTVGEIGDEVRNANLFSDGLTAAQQRITAERDGYSGVDVNEEMVNLMRFQNAFQAAAKTITVIDEMMQELLNIIR